MTDVRTQYLGLFMPKPHEMKVVRSKFPQQGLLSRPKQPEQLIALIGNTQKIRKINTVNYFMTRCNIISVINIYTSPFVDGPHIGSRVTGCPPSLMLYIYLAVGFWFLCFYDSSERGQASIPDLDSNFTNS
ncbi:hypothetical protein RF11_15532 [Thelohanellus kitauei]|uniref:Uncharacterized protein n=1 Tax=Thelohanellus kitauei TaxID=669202 RepID=A0A0C2M446_THEKT|nr:hypothetical protein RF11_15532 [Thelohanellus kitauei]